MAEIIYLYDYRLRRQKAKDDEIEQKRYEEQCKFDQMWEYQHSDDDSFENANEFTVIDRNDQ